MAVAGATLVAGAAAVILSARVDGRADRVGPAAASGAQPTSPGSGPPLSPHLAGQLVRFVLSSPAVGRSQPVLVYLPPGYASHPRRRYPVMYLLHGSPGGVLGLIQLGILPLEDQLVGERRIAPLIIVMPQGVRGTEWANGPRPLSAWEDFVARDVVHAVDRRFRTIASGGGRAIAGLSAGGYGALNVAIHHPGEFRVVESWSGYGTAAPDVFRRIARLVAYNSPAEQIGEVAARLRAFDTYIWFYVGIRDPLRRQNERFAAELAELGIAYRFFVAPGGHDHLLWRTEAALALTAASARLASGS